MCQSRSDLVSVHCAWPPPPASFLPPFLLDIVEYGVCGSPFWTSRSACRPERTQSRFTQ